MKFKKLFEPLMIGTMEVKNRIVMLPMTTHFAEEGFVTDQMKAHYVERAKGGAGMITVEDAVIQSPVGHHSIEPLLITDDKYIPGLRDLATAIKAQGARAALHITHGGRRSGRIEVATGLVMASRGNIPVAPSMIAHPVPGFLVPRELTLEEIEELIELFAQAAVRARKAGFDAIQLHCAHMYLLNEFLSPLANRRQDKYGGDFERRFTFLKEVIAAIKKEVGDDYPIMARVNGEEQEEGGLTVHDLTKIAQRMEQEGIKAVHVSIGAVAVLPIPGFVPSVAPARLPRACIVHLAETIKKGVSIPVGTAQRIPDPVLAESILEEGKADLIGMGRALLADPELPNKAAEGRLDDIRPCIYCIQGCLQRLWSYRQPVRCTVNATAGRETELKIRPAEKHKKVVVIGGGPGGMEAARVAALRGHEVTLFEAKTELGGLLRLAIMPPGKEEFQNFLNYLITQVNKLGVKVELGKRATQETVEQLKPDVVILATGSKPLIPQIPGINSKNVVTAHDILEGRAEAKEKVAILGGGTVGVEMTEYLAVRGKKVTVIEILPQVAEDMPHITRQLLLFSLADKGVKILTKTTTEEITDSGVVVTRKGQRQTIDADTVVVAAGAEPERELAEKLRYRVPEFYAVGDCSQARRIDDAVREAFEVAAAI